MTISSTSFLLLLALSTLRARSMEYVEDYYSDDAFVAATAGECQLSIDYRTGDLKEPQPLILTDTEEPRFVLPEKHRVLIIPEKSSILLACPGVRNRLANVAGSRQYARATCLGGKNFLVDSQARSFSELTCQQFPRETVRRMPGSRCLGGGHEKLEIGFAFEPERFVQLMEVYRDARSLRTYYIKHTIPKEISSYQSGFPRPIWKSSGWHYPGYNVNRMYQASAQLETVSGLLGSEEHAKKFIRPGEQRYLNRGHLAAKADFVYGAQQSATFWYLNTAPQWASFNAGNWLAVENAVRYVATSRRLDLVVYTGVHGTTSLPDVGGAERELYLWANGTERAFAVPRFYWKIIHEPVGNRAVAFVGLNEPYASDITEDMFLCPDISHEEAFSWLSWSPRDIERGVSYVCSVEELRKSVPTVPTLGETGLLT